MEHDWPGNVRELKNAVESAAVMTNGDTIGAGDFEGVQLRAVRAAGGRGALERTTPVTAPISMPFLDESRGGQITIPANASLSDVERILIADRLRRSRTKAEAARGLGIGLRTLYTKIHALRLVPSAVPRHGDTGSFAESAYPR
jgi:DNA-binding NtrC family response regulator